VNDEAASERSGAVPVPTLETERFILRPFSDADIVWLTEMHLNPEVVRYLRPAGADPVMNEEEARALAHTIREKYRFGPDGIWAADDRTSGEALGWAALKNLDKTDEIEVGYGLRRGAWGRGVATEVARRLVRHGFEDRGLERIVGVTHPDNIASQNVLRKAGLTYLGLVNRYYGRETTYFEIRGDSKQIVCDR
jgi:RimJ/RimL family protein N-acetyltransferase